MSENEKLLTVEEQNACQKIAASDARLASQRAAALLALDEGATRAQASEQTGLTAGQIGYLLRTFRQKHLAIFPGVEPDEAQPLVEAAKSEENKKKTKKLKKGKKDKKAKTRKKAKKPKKSKKDKKSKAAKKKESKKRK